MQIGLFLPFIKRQSAVFMRKAKLAHRFVNFNEREARCTSHAASVCSINVPNLLLSIHEIGGVRPRQCVHPPFISDPAAVAAMLSHANLEKSFDSHA